MTTLTAGERRVLHTIQLLQDKLGKNPSYREVMHALNYRSTASVYRLVQSLIRKGRLPQTSRSWRNLSMETQSSHTDSTVEIDIIGSVIRARPPQLFEHPKRIGIPHSLFIPGASIYGLYIQDASFIEEQMIPNDLIIVHADATIQKGDLVLASTNVSIIGRCHEEEDRFRFLVSPYTNAEEIRSIVTDASSTQLWGTIIGLIRDYSSSISSSSAACRRP